MTPSTGERTGMTLETFIMEGMLGSPAATGVFTSLLNQIGYAAKLVTSKVRRAGPDRRMHEGVEIEAVTHSTTTIDGTPHKTTLIHRSVYLKGFGEVESTSRTEGEAGSVTRRLVGFTPGGDLE